MIKLRLREVKFLAHSHKDSKSWNQDLSSGLSNCRIFQFYSLTVVSFHHSWLKSLSLETNGSSSQWPVVHNSFSSSTVGDIDNDGSESPRKDSVKPAFGSGQKYVRRLTEISSQGHYSKSKQASKEKFCYSKLCCLEFSLRCSTSSRKPDTEGITDYTEQYVNNACIRNHCVLCRARQNRFLENRFSAGSCFESCC